MLTNTWTQEEFPIDVERPEFWLKEMNDTDQIYEDLILDILRNGLWKQNRTGVRTISIFGPQVTFSDVGNKFPILTTRKLHMKSIVGELLWFLSGSTDKNVLKNKYGVSIWDEWNAPNPKFDGDMGPIYGSQWVNWNGEGINQIQQVINTLKTNPDDRRMLVTAWNPSKLKEQALPPCHWSFQFYTNQRPNEEKRRLHLIWNQRSVDSGLGLPFNIASYAIMLLMMAQEVDMIPGDLIGNLGDTHIYENHISQLVEQLTRNSKGEEPKMILNPEKGFWDFKPEDFTIVNYVYHPAIKMPISI